MRGRISTLRWLANAPIGTAKDEDLGDRCAMKTKPPSNRAAQLAFGSAIAILLVVGAFSYRAMVASDESEQRVRHSHEVIENLLHLLLAMTRIETIGRGFILTGDEAYLESYPASISSTNQHGATVRTLTADNPEQQRELPVLEELIAQKVQFQKMVGDLRRTRGLDAAVDAIRSGRGQQITDEFQAVVRRLQNEELRLLAHRNADAERSLGQTKVILIAGTFLGLLITTAAGWTVQRDSSRRGRAEEALRDSEEQYRTLGEKYRGLLEAAPDAMVVVNQDGEIVLLNVQAEKQFGYRRDELLGQKVTNIIPEGFAERLIADDLRSAENALAQQIGTGIELIARRKDGSEFPIEIMLSPLDSAEGTLVTAAIRDITARRAAAANLLQKVEELNRSNEELGQFAYMASHDLQEPLRMVASYTQLLARRYKGKLDSDADEFIAFAVDGANRMQRLIQDLLSYSRVGTRGSNLRDISSEDALRQALVNLRGAVKESGALVTHDPLPAVLADETQLTQLFQNLVGNAIKYQNPGVPKVHIAAAMNGGKKWTFSVQDNGLGIDSQYFEKIFGMFQRLHKREAFAGTGIGLAICKKIVEQHGGHISIESQPGQGSTFRFTLARSEKTS
jgi:PAS domain S-box-containing protein